jgi:hypothetical protein
VDTRGAEHKAREPQIRVLEEEARLKREQEARRGKAIGGEVAGGEIIGEESVQKAPVYNKCQYLYFRYVNPWIRPVIINVVVIYIYCVLLSIVTWRNANYFQQTHDYPRPPMIHPMRRPTDGWRPLILADWMYDLIPAPVYEGPSFQLTKLWVDFAVCIPVGAIFIVCLARKDIIRLTEYAAYTCCLFGIMYCTKILTNYPSPSGLDPSCTNPQHLTLGTWIFSNLTTDYCGDQMFSGHTLNTLLPLLMLNRIWYDWVGWDFRLPLQTRQKGPYGNRSHRGVKESAVQNPRRSENGELATTSGVDNVEPLERPRTVSTNNLSQSQEAIEHSSDAGSSSSSSGSSSSSEIGHRDSGNFNDQVNGYVEECDNRDNRSHQLSQEHNESERVIPIKDSHLYNIIDHDPFHSSVVRTYHVAEPLPFHNEEANYTDNNSDYFMSRRNYRRSPPFVLRNPRCIWCLLLLWRIVIVLWMVALGLALLRVRQHYSSDIITSIIVTILVSHNQRLGQTLVRFFYRPNFWNYRRTGFFSLVDLEPPFTKQQVSYYERLRFVGRGGGGSIFKP